MADGEPVPPDCLSVVVWDPGNTLSYARTSARGCPSRGGSISGGGATGTRSWAP